MRLLALAAPLLLAGCFNSPNDDTAADTDLTGGNGGDTDSTPVQVAIDDAEAVQSSEISTVMTVTWTTDQPGTSVVEWGTDTGYGHRTTDDGTTSTTHTVVVPAMSTDSTIHWRARSVVDGTALVSEDQTVETEIQAQGLPAILVDGIEAGQFSSGFRVLPLGGNPAPIVVLDDAGKIAWWAYLPEDLVVTDSHIDIDNAHVDVLVADIHRTDDLGAVVRIPWATPSDQESIPLTLSHHAYVQTPDGHYVYLYADFKTFGSEQVVGDKVIEVDANGQNPRTLFSTWDQWGDTMDIDKVREDDTRFYPGALDWTHGNSINYLPEEDAFIVSFHNLGTFIKLDRDGTLEWTMGGPESSVSSDLSLAGDSSTSFYDQHNPQLVDENHVILMDNGPYDCLGDNGCYSQAAEYEIDWTSMTYTRTWTYDWDQSHVILLMGDVQQMANGNILTNWGYSGKMMEVTPDGQEVWGIHSGTSNIFGFSEFSPTLGGAVH